MSYIAVDLKVIEVHAPGVARALGMDVPAVIGSLTLLWHRCWSTKSDTLPSAALRGYFTHPDSGEVLVAFGLLEVAGSTYRVKGADRYLRLSEQRKTAGKARSSSAGRSAGRFTSTKPADHQRTTSGPPAADQPLHRAPSTEHRMKETSVPAAPARDSDLLCEDFKATTGSAYLWQGAKDGVALAELLKAATLEEVRTRWRRGLKANPDDWASCRTVAQLRQKWNDLAGGKDAPRPNPEHRPLRHLG